MKIAKKKGDFSTYVLRDLLKKRPSTDSGKINPVLHQKMHNIATSILAKTQKEA